MAIAFVAASAVVTGANPTVAIPTGYAEGNLLVLVTTGSATPTTPTGWTQRYAQGGSQFITVLTKYAGSTESSVAVTLSGTSSKATMLCYSGAGSYDVVGTIATGSSTTATTTSQTTTYANDYILSIFARTTGTSTFTTPTGTTSRVNSSSATGINGLLLVDELQAAAGASTARSTTLSATGSWSAISVSFVPTRTLYWVNNSGTWNSSTTGRWANTSGGSPTGVLPPVANESVIIDSSSGTGTITCTSGASCGDLTVTATQAIVLGAAGSALSVYGNLTFPSGGSFSASTNANTITLAAGSAKTVTPNDKTFSSLTFNGVGGNWTLPSTITVNATATLTAGTITLSTNTTTLSCNAFSSSGTTTRAIAFGTGNITTTGSGTAWTSATATGLTYTGTPTVNIANNSATATTITAGTTGGASTNALNFNFTTGTYALTVTDASNIGSLNFTGFTGSWTTSATLNLYTNLTLVSGMTFTDAGNTISFVNTTGTATIVTGGLTFSGNITQNGTGGTLAIPSSLTVNTYTLTAGTTNLNTNSATLSCTTFSSDNTNTRAITFGTGGVANITVTGSGVAWNTATTTGFTTSGTTKINISNNSAIATTISNSNTAGTLSFNFNITVGTYALTITTGSRVAALNFTGFTGSWAPGTATLTITGNLTLVAGMTFTAGSGTWTISGTSTITSAGFTLNSITQSSGVTVTLAAGTTSTGVYTLSQGTLQLGTNSATLSCTRFASTSNSTRVIAFGTAGNITVTGSGTTMCNMDITTGFTYTGTPTVNIANNSATASTLTMTGGIESNVLNFNITTGTYALTIADLSTFKSLDYTGFAGSWPAVTGNSATIYGNYTLSTGMTISSTNAPITLAATSGTQVVNLAGKTVGSITQDGVGGTVQFIAGTSTLATNRFYTLTNGTLDLGTNTATLSCGTFDTNNANSRTIAFGTGNITVTGSGTIWNTSDASNFTYTGTPTVNVAGTGSPAIASHITGATEANVVDFYFTGSSTVSLTTSADFGTIDFTGFTGTWSPGTSVYNIYRNIALGSGMTFTTGSGVWTLVATSSGASVQTITCNGKTLGPITQNNIGSAVTLGDAFISNGAYTFSNGTINGNNKNFTALSFASTGTNTRAINMGSGTWTLSGTGSVWNVIATNLTINANTSNIVLSDTTTADKTFVGAGKTYNTLTLGGSTGIANYYITGANTFGTLASGKSVTSTVILPASTTTTLTSFSLNGSNGNALYLTSSTSGTQATLNVSSTFTADYLFVYDNNLSSTNGTVTNGGLNNTTGWTVGSGSSNFSVLTSNAGIFTVPSSWDNANNTIHIIGGGGGGASGSGSAANRAGGGGGGGGGYAKLANQSYTTGQSIIYSAGLGGIAGTGGVSATAGTTSYWDGSAATIAYVSSQLSRQTSSSSNITVTRPTYSTGDLMIMIVNSGSATNTWTTPTGWTAGSNNASARAVFYKIAVASEPATYTVSQSTSATSTGTILVYSNAVWGGDGANTARSTSLTPTATVSLNSSTVIYCVYDNNASITCTTPTGYTSRQSDTDVTTPSQTVFDISGISTGAYTAPTSSTSGNARAFLVVVSPKVTSSTVYASGGNGGTSTTTTSTGGTGGTGTGGTINFTGGTGGTGSISTGSNSQGGGGGGGAAGPNGNGAAGGNGIIGTSNSTTAGGGGGGNSGGTIGGNASTSTGGTGGNNNSSVGGGTPPGGAGSYGGGGAGTNNQLAGGNGGNGIDIIAIAGSGGGSGAAAAGGFNTTTTAGLYGGGGGGDGVSTSGGSQGGGGDGAQGVIVVLWGTVAPTPPAGGTSNFFLMFM